MKFPPRASSKRTTTGGQGDTATILDSDSRALKSGLSGFATTISMLKEIGEMTVRVPYVKAAAGVVLRILEITDQITLYHERVAEVVENVRRMAGVVSASSDYCKDMGFETEDDLPPHVRQLLHSLKGELEEVEQVLLQCKGRSKWAQRKLNVLRSDMLKKIDRCDRRMRNIVDAFNTSVIFSIRVSQNARALNIPPKSYISGLPSMPQVFHGRTAEVDRILQTISSHTRAPARIAILGAGGVGKTALALAVLHAPSIQERFGDAIFFTSCDACTSAIALLSVLAKTLKLTDEAYQLDEAIISHFASLSQCILCLDSFEAPWNQDVHEKRAVEAFLSRLTSISSLTLLVTMRGVERPAETAWSLPFLPALGPLTFDTAHKIFHDISGHQDEWTERLVHAVEGLPLAVTLLAHLAQSVPPRQLWQRWMDGCVGTVERVQGHRLTSLEVSIQLSIEGGRVQMDAGANALLGVLAVLPGGLRLDKAPEFQALLGPSVGNVLQSVVPLQRSGLVYCTEDGVLKLPALIRYHCLQHHLPTDEQMDALQSYYTKLLLRDNKGKPEVYQYQLSELANIDSIICICLNSKRFNEAVINTVIQFSFFTSEVGLFTQHMLDFLYLNRDSMAPDLVKKFLPAWGHCLRLSQRHPEAEYRYLETLSYFQDRNDRAGIADTLGGLGSICYARQQWGQAIAYHEKSLEIHRSIGSIDGEASDLHRLGNLYAYINKLSLAKEYLHKSLELSKRTNYPPGEASDYFALGGLAIFEGQLDAAESWYTQARDLYVFLNDAISQAHVASAFGDIHSQRGDVARAKECYTQALNVYAALRDLTGQMNALRALGIMHYDCGHIDDALAYFADALTFSEELDDVEAEGAVLHLVGKIGEGLRQLDPAAQYLRRAIECHDMLGHRGRRGDSLYVLGHVFSADGIWHVARAYWAEAAELFEVLETWGHMRARVLVDIGNSYVMEGMVVEAQCCLLDAVRVCEEFGEHECMVMALEKLGLMYEGEGLWEEASKMYREGLAMHDLVKDDRLKERLEKHLRELEEARVYSPRNLPHASPAASVANETLQPPVLDPE
ncbi:TPR-like protein [Artomyces pyxidatus]|uniref:TPR-like protein n=1 Tax=Artomyces pyxidatus TaxID=48021 RepID=A0ACB8TGN0_9AGAM|nr:TPR-like protein [Artomyces pyxidatus]